jgi:hypothetical protein
MRRISFLAFATVLLFLFSCDNNSSNRPYLLESLGNINTLQVVIDNDLWNSEVGETIRTHFAAPVDGLPQDEPLLSMNQMPPETYTDFARKYRSFLHVTLGDQEGISIEQNPYAKPQTGTFIIARSKEGLIRLLEENHQRIMAAFKKTELNEKQSRIRISLKKMDSLEKFFGVTFNMPSAYRTALATPEFCWYRKNLKQGETNVIVYQVPMSMITADSTLARDIIKIRDSIGGSLLPVEDEDSRFITESAYAPYLFTTKIDDHFAYESKGIWEVTNQWMGGPFINYAVRDSVNNRYLILEGFVYAPATSKRDLQFELEAILRSTRFLK